MRETWLNLWMPAEDRYVEEQRPHERADYVVLGYAPGGDAATLGGDET